MPRPIPPYPHRVIHITIPTAYDKEIRKFIAEKRELALYESLRIKYKPPS